MWGTNGGCARIRVLAVQCGLVALCMPSSDVYADSYCEYLPDNFVILGEARYRALAGAGNDEAYANCYWDGVDELELSYYYVGGAHAAGSIWFDMYAYFQDSGTDCAAVTFEFGLDRSDTGSGTCPTGYSTSTDTLAVNSCSGGGSDMFYVGRRFDQGPIAYKKYWRATIGSSGDEATVSDEGCFILRSEAECIQDNF